MEADPRLSAALSLLLDGSSAARGQGILVTAEALASGQLDLPGASVVAAAELATELEARLGCSQPPVIVAASGLERDPRALRVLRRGPPALLVLTGEATAEAASHVEVDGAALLGPGACLRIGAGDREPLLICAPEASGLDELTTALGVSAIGLALAPTPRWLVTWLEGLPPEFRAIGFVGAEVLDIAWSRWIRGLPLAEAARHLLVPLGIAPPEVEVPRSPTLAPAVAAHALERLSGPIFPAAAVLAAIAAAHEAPRGAAPSERLPERLEGRWAQARRALPLTGATPGMEAPLPGLPVADPGAAYLAQRVLLRQRQSLARGQEALALTDDGFGEDDPIGEERSLEVLRGAGEILSEHESKVVLHGFGIEVTRQAVASSASGAASFAEQIGFPVVLKAVSPDLRRKRELGAVVLDLTTAAAVRRAYASIVANVEEKAPAAHLDGVLIAEQIADGLELHCGAIRIDSGEVALYGRPIGLGLPQEQVLVASPLSATDALLFANALLARVPVPALRRRSDPDVAVLAGLFRRLDALVVGSEGRLLSVELRPVRIIGGERGYVTLDARIIQRPHLEGL